MVFKESLHRRYAIAPTNMYKKMKLKGTNLLMYFLWLLRALHGKKVHASNPIIRTATERATQTRVLLSFETTSNPSATIKTGTKVRTNMERKMPYTFFTKLI